MPDAEDVDAVVIGASMRGLVAAHVLSDLGRRTVVVERASVPGGVDGSFVTDRGTVFDHGLHVLDEMRSELTTRLFSDVVGGEVHRTILRRAIVLRGHVLPYAPEPSDLPAELRSLLGSDRLVDDVGDELPTFERLARCYGEEFVTLVFEEVLPSFPAEHRHREFGVETSRLLANIYPWFFPRARYDPPSIDESRVFHDKLRAGAPQPVFYPRQGGFGGFAQGFVVELNRRGVEVMTGGSDLHVELELGPQGVRRVAWVDACGRRFRADHYFWAQGWAPLCRLLHLPCQDVATDRVVLGSFRLDRHANGDHHEILVGDPAFHVNRIHFPAGFRHSDEPLMQVEFAYPVRDERWPSEPRQWHARWLDDARRLGILDVTHRVEEFDFRSFTMHFNGFGAEGEPLRDADPSMVAPESKVWPLVPSMANLNLNRYVPRVVRDVTAVVADAS